MTVVFNSTNDTTATGAADFATAANDALQVLEYIHDNAASVAGARVGRS